MDVLFPNAFELRNLNSGTNPDFLLVCFWFLWFLINLPRDAPEDFRNKTMWFASLISLIFELIILSILKLI